jgi:hypothetical protein
MPSGYKHHIVKRPSTPTSPTLSFQHLSVIPSLVSGPSLSPSVSPLKPPLCPLSPMRPIITDLKGDCQPCVSPPHPHVPLPSQGASVVGQSARTMPARESPSWQFFASPDQIDALGMPRSWIHGQVITTLSNTVMESIKGNLVWSKVARHGLTWFKGEKEAQRVSS